MLYYLKEINLEGWAKSQLHNIPFKYRRYTKTLLINSIQEKHKKGKKYQTTITTEM